MSSYFAKARPTMFKHLSSWWTYDHVIANMHLSQVWVHHMITTDVPGSYVAQSKH